MPITMICPNLKCGKTVIAPDHTRGKVVRCAYCHQTFMVPRETRAARTEPTDENPAKDTAERKGKSS